MIETWDDLDFWKSDDWYWLDDWLKQWASDKKKVNPSRELLFAALDAVPLKDVKVMIVGQDPYPDSQLATGVAFSIPPKIKPEDFPPTLQQIFKEYCNDLHYPYPGTGSLQIWTDQGVLLWNAIPSCFAGQTLSHNYPQWRRLTDELVRVVSEHGAVVALLGGVAREFKGSVHAKGRCIETSHPSPRGSRFSKQPFLGSRIFSRINAELVSLKKEPINWRLP